MLLMLPHSFLDGNLAEDYGVPEAGPLKKPKSEVCWPT